MSRYQPQLRVHVVWYEQPTQRHVDRGLASIRLVTDEGGYSRTVPLTEESVRDAQATATRLGVRLVVAAEMEIAPPPAA